MWDFFLLKKVIKDKPELGGVHAFVIFCSYLDGDVLAIQDFGCNVGNRGINTESLGKRELE